MKPRSLITLFSVTAILLSLFALAVPAHAENNDILKASEVLDSSATSGLVELSPSEMSGKIKELYQDSFTKTISSQFDLSWYATEEETAYVTKATDAIQKALENNPYSIALISKEAEITTHNEISFIEMSELDFLSEVVSNLRQTSLFSEDSYKGIGIYTIKYDSPTYLNHNRSGKGKELRAELIDDTSFSQTLYDFMYYKGYLIKGNKADLEAMLDSTTPLSSSENFKSVVNELEPAAMNVFYDMKEVKDTLKDEMSFNDWAQDSLGIIDAAKAIGVSGSQSANGFRIHSYYLQNESKIRSLGYDFGSFPKPSLYKYMPQEMPIFFVDSTTSTKNIKKSAEMLSLMLKDFDEKFADTGLTETILESAGTETAFLLQGPTGESLVPQFTFLARTSGKTDAMIRSNLKLASEALWTQMQNEKGTSVLSDNKMTLNDAGVSMAVERSTVTIDGAEAYQFTGNLIPKHSKNPYAVSWPSDAFRFTLTFGLMDNSILLLSTNNDIVTEYKADLSNNKDVAPYLKGDNSSVGYFNMPNLSDYFYKAVKTMDLNSKSDMQYQEIGKILDAGKEILKEVAITGKSTNSYIRTDIEVNMDFSKIDELVNVFNSIDNFSPDAINNSTTEFSDVNGDEWYGDTVYEMATEGIVNGNEDGTFTPSAQMTRAEFVKILMKVVEKSPMYTPYEVSRYMRDDDFKTFADVPAYSWFETPVYEAYNLGLMSGQNKETFNPYAPLQRDQAAKVIANAIQKYAPESNITVDTSENKFKDTKNNPFLQDILMINKLGIMTGEKADKFNPSRPLNKAEGTKILNDLANLLK